VTERGMVERKRPAGSGKGQENAKKILNRGNELKDLLKTKDLGILVAKNELKTNSILSAKMRNLEPKNTAQVAGFRQTAGSSNKPELVPLSLGSLLTRGEDWARLYTTLYTTGPSGVGACSTFRVVLWPWGKGKVQWSAVVE